MLKKISIALFIYSASLSAGSIGLWDTGVKRLKIRSKKHKSAWYSTKSKRRVPKCLLLLALEQAEIEKYIEKHDRLPSREKIRRITQRILNDPSWQQESK